MSAIETLVQQPAAQAMGWALLQFIWQGAVIGVLTALVLAALRRSAADVRYVVATIALSLMLTMPVVTALQAWNGANRRAVAAALPPESGVAAVSPGAALDAVPRPDLHAAVAAGSERSESRSPAASREGLADRAMPVLLLAWLVGVSILSVRLMSGWIWVQHAKSHGAAPVADAVERLGERLKRHLHIRRRVRLLESPIVDVPTVIGWLKPVVLLPASALGGLTPQQLEAILAHELAHIRRHDYLVNLLQTLVETLLFYHPAVWWLSRRIRVERENCCDDLAVNLCGDRVVYAQALADLEQLRGTGGRFALAATGGSLLHRVRRVLGAPSHAGRGPGWLAGCVAIVLILTMAAVAAGTIRGQEVPVPLVERPFARDVAAGLRDGAHQLRDGAHQLKDGMHQLRDGAHGVRDAVHELRDEFKDNVRELRDEIKGSVREIRDEVKGGARELRDELKGGARELRDEVKSGLHMLQDLAAFFIGQAPPVPPDPPDPPDPIEPPHPIDPPDPPHPPDPVDPPYPPAPPEPPVLAESGAALPAPPAPPAPVAPLAPPAPPSQRREQSGNFTWSHNGEKLQVQYRGEIEFTDDDSDVRSLSPGGWLRIKEGGWFGGRAVEIRADNAGNIERRFWLGSSERPFEPEGRKWLSQNLPRFIRQTGIGAPRRVARIMSAKGVPGVLAEISLVEGSWAKRVYFAELLKTPGLQGSAVQQALAQAGREIDSDFELASLLIASDGLLKDDAARKAYLDAAKTIGSDFEMRRVLSSALKAGNAGSALVAGLLETSTAIESDFEEASLLVQVAKLHPVDGATRAPFFKALATVDSDFEHRRVLSAVMGQQAQSPEVVAAVLDSVTEIDSDFEAATLLVQVAKDRAIEGALRAPFFRAVDGIGSAFERSRVLQTVAKRSDASADTILNVVRSASTIGSNFESSEVLLAVARTHTLTAEARNAYMDAAERLGDFEQGRVLTALVKSERRK